MAIVCFTLDETKQTTAGATSVQPKEDKESLTRRARVDEEGERRNTREGREDEDLRERLTCDEQVLNCCSRMDESRVLIIERTLF